MIIKELISGLAYTHISWWADANPEKGNVAGRNGKNHKRPALY